MEHHPESYHCSGNCYRQRHRYTKLYLTGRYAQDNIDQDEIVNYIVKEAKKDGMGPYDPDDVFFVVQGEMEYGNSLGQVD